MHFSNYFINNSKSYLSPRTSQDQPAALTGIPAPLLRENDGSPIPLQALEAPRSPGHGATTPIWGARGELPGYSRFKGPRLTWSPGPPHWFSQALSICKAHGQSLQPIQGWLQLPWELLGASAPREKTPPGPHLKLQSPKSSVTVKAQKVHHLATPQGAASRVRAVYSPPTHGSSQVF